MDGRASRSAEREAEAASGASAFHRAVWPSRPFLCAAQRREFQPGQVTTTLVSSIAEARPVAAVIAYIRMKMREPLVSGPKTAL